jgi:ABC-2 type transport system ATP-binding protein
MTSPEPCIVEVENLRKVFKDFWGRSKIVALDRVSFKLFPGEVCALVGPNGSGKTTLVKILLGLLFPTSGSSKLFGENSFELTNKARIGFLAEENCFYPHLSGQETLDFYGKLLRLPKKQRLERIQELLELTDMTEAAHRPIGEYSLGMLRRIGIAQALLADPELLILDEPTNGLDPIGIEDVHQLIQQLKARKKSVLICTHLLSETEDICDNICLLFKGKMLASGSLEELHLNYGTRRMKELFLKLVPRKNQSPEEQEHGAHEAENEGPAIDIVQNQEPQANSQKSLNKDYLDQLGP